jgi:hypothetical protein
MDRSSEAPTNLIALRDGKQRAEELISTRYAEGLIDQDELERRLEAVTHASTLAVLERQIVDLVEPGTSPSAALARRSPATAPSTALARREDVAAQRRIIAVFGSHEERGRWTPARCNELIGVFATAVIDLREATLGPGETEIELRCVFTSAEVLVPPGLAVRVDAGVIFSSVEREPEIPAEPAGPGDPVVVLTGVLVLASLELYERRVGESKRDARRRHAGQRRIQKAQGGFGRGR